MLALAACDSFTSVTGRVADPAGRPVVGALVILRRVGVSRSEVSDVSRTDSAGHFEAMIPGGFRSPDALLSVCIRGFAPEKRWFRDQASVRDLPITLEPRDRVGPRCDVPPGALVRR